MQLYASLFVSSAVQVRVRSGGGRGRGRTSGRELMRRRLSTAEMALQAVAGVGFSRLVSIVIGSCVGKDTHRTHWLRWSIVVAKPTA